MTIHGYPPRTVLGPNCVQSIHFQNRRSRVVWYRPLSSSTIVHPEDAFTDPEGTGRARSSLDVTR